MNIALLSNSLINRTLAFHTSYVLGREIEDVLLPVENHSSDEILFSEREHIHIYDNIEEIINKSDIIITTNKDGIRKLPESKKAVFINNPWTHENEIVMDSNCFCRTSGKPVIAILSLGRFTDQYYTEILVNKILSESGVKIYQKYSRETRSIISDLSEHGLLNHSLLELKEEKTDIVVISIDGTKFHNDAEFVCELNRVSPDMLFVCTDRTIENVDGIDNIAGIVRQVNLTIRSPYISYDVGTGVKYPVYCGFFKDNTSVSSLDRDLESCLKNQIIKCLYFPSGTVFL